MKKLSIVLLMVIVLGLLPSCQNKIIKSSDESDKFLGFWKLKPDIVDYIYKVDDTIDKHNFRFVQNLGTSAQRTWKGYYDKEKKQLIFDIYPSFEKEEYFCIDEKDINKIYEYYDDKSDPFELTKLENYTPTTELPKN